MNIADLVSRLAALDLNETASGELARQGADLADQVRVALSNPPGGPHTTPWRQTGSLRDSVGMSADGDEVLIGSTSSVALYQEHGTSTLPPRPGFGPIALDHGEAVAHDIAAAVAATLSNAIRSA